VADDDVGDAPTKEKDRQGVILQLGGSGGPADRGGGSKLWRRRWRLQILRMAAVFAGVGEGCEQWTRAARGVGCGGRKALTLVGRPKKNSGVSELLKKRTDLN
jgi:hypothetical protein